MGQWSVTRDGAARIVLLVYKGDMVNDEGELASREFVRLAGSDSVILCADFVELLTYQSRVRTDWQKNVWPIRKQLAGVFCATQNKLVKMGVAAFCLFLGISCTFLKTRAELDARMKQLAREANASA